MLLNFSAETRKVDSILIFLMTTTDDVTIVDQLIPDFLFLRNSLKLYLITMKHMWSLIEFFFNTNIF